MPTVQKFTRGIRQHWRYLLQFGTWVMTLLSSFVLPPPIWDFKQHNIWFRFAHFLVAALVGLMFIPITRWAGKKDTWRWALLTVLTLSLGIFAFFEYQALRDDWTTTYAGKPIIIGSTYSSDALKYKERVRAEDQREVSDKELVMAAAGRTEDVWDIKEIHRRGRILAGAYLSSIALFAASIISLVQALYCNSKPDGRKPKKAKDSPPA